MVTDTPAEEAAMSLGATGWATEPGATSHPGGSVTPILGELRWTSQRTEDTAANTGDHRGSGVSEKLKTGSSLVHFLEVEVWLLQLGENGLWVNPDGNRSLDINRRIDV